MVPNDVRRALSAYGKQSLDTSVEQASPHKLIVMLFDGAIASLNQAKFHMENAAIAEKGQAISRAIAIIEDGLRLSLDKEKGGELAENLDSLYDYISYRLLLANLENSLPDLEQGLDLLVQLRSSWVEIDLVINQSANDLEASNRNQALLSYGRV